VKSSMTINENPDIIVNTDREYIKLKSLTMGTEKGNSGCHAKDEQKLNMTGDELDIS
jgi:hypothetical protein